MKNNFSFLKIIAALLLVFTVFIFIIDFNFGSKSVRPYVTDIKGDILLFGINTTINTVLLILIAYNYILCLTKGRISSDGKKNFTIFFILQIFVFLFLAMDERFMVHEKVGFILGFNDAYFLLFLGILTLGNIIYYPGIPPKKDIQFYNLLIAGCLFSLMIVVDAYAPLSGRFRLSIEDLSKSWATFFLFVYSYIFYARRLEIQK